jgi:copper chaperone
MESVTLVSPDISCGHCQQTIEREVGGMQGVERVAVDIDTKRVAVTYDPARTSRETIVQKLDEEGYPVAS